MLDLNPQFGRRGHLGCACAPHTRPSNVPNHSSSCYPMRVLHWPGRLTCVGTDRFSCPFLFLVIMSWFQHKPAVAWFPSVSCCTYSGLGSTRSEYSESERKGSNGLVLILQGECLSCSLSIGGSFQILFPRVACDHIGEEFSEYSGSLYREDAQKPSSYVAQTSSGRQVASPARTANKALLSSFTDGSVENDAISPLAGGALSRSTLPSVQNLLKHLSSPKTKAAPSYRKLATQGDEELFVLPEIRPRSSGREPAAPSPAKASHAVGLSGFLLDPVFSSSNSCVVPKGEPLLPSNSSLRHSKPQSKSSKVVVIPATRRK